MSTERRENIADPNFLEHYRRVLNESGVLDTKSGEYVMDKIIGIPEAERAVRHIIGLVVIMKNSLEMFLDESYTFNVNTLDKRTVRDLFNYPHDTVRRHLDKFFNDNPPRGMVGLGIFLTQDVSGVTYLTLGSEIAHIEKNIRESPESWIQMMKKYGIDKLICKGLDLGENQSNYIIGKNSMRGLRLDTFIKQLARKHHMTAQEYLVFSSMVHRQEVARDKLGIAAESYDQIITKVLSDRKKGQKSSL